MNTTNKTLSLPIAESTWRFPRHYMGFANLVLLLFKTFAADLKPFGYYKCPYTHGLWKDKSGPISFTFFVDNFGVKYTNKVDAEHLESIIRENFPMTIDWSGSKVYWYQLRLELQQT